MHMNFKKGLISALVVLSGVSTGQAAVTGSYTEASKSRQATNETRQLEAQSKQSKTKTPAPSPTIDQGPSNIDRVNKALNPGPSNPDVPLPHPDLSNSGSGRLDASSAPQIYGRQEEGGGVLGLKMPIPANRSAPTAGTRSSSP
jgi:hypothetical protein